MGAEAVRETQLVIVGAGSHGREILSYLDDLSQEDVRIRLAGFIDEEKQKGSFRGAIVLGDLKDLETVLEASPAELYYIAAIGRSDLRKQLVERIEGLQRPNLLAWTLRHRAAFVGANVEIGKGTCLAPGSVITTHVSLGRHGIVNVNASISHDCTIGDFVSINPGVVICGNVTIGEGCFVGTGSTIINKVSIGAWTVIGAGSVVTEDIPSHVTAVGVPARVIKRHYDIDSKLQ